VPADVTATGVGVAAGGEYEPEGAGLAPAADAACGAGVKIGCMFEHAGRHANRTAAIAMASRLGAFLIFIFMNFPFAKRHNQRMVSSAKIGGKHEDNQRMPRGGLG
jgi:hypothetical protein